jgi:hypothetical protein
MSAPISLSGLVRYARGHAALALCLVFVAIVAGHPARALAGAPAITTQPALQPSFASNLPNYVTHCEPGPSVDVSVRAMGNPVSVDSGPALMGDFVKSVTLASGQAFTIQVGTGASAKTYNVRCLPPDFPEYRAQVFGPRQAAYYLTTPDFSNKEINPPSTYVALFDNNGVPVWWYRSTEGLVVDADLDPNGDLSWALETGGEQDFGVPGTVHVEQRDLDGNLVNTFQTAGTPSDFHEAWSLANGNFLIDSYVLQTNVSLQLLGNPFTVNVVDASFQEVRPDRSVAFSWSSVGHIGPAESIKYWYFYSAYPGLSGNVWDWQHINSVMPYENGYLVSLGNTGAVYYIDAATGDVVWKLGGTHTPQSLKIIGDPEASSDFLSQHDARAWPDGTVSVFDNGTREFRPPRVVRFKIDAAARTATLVQTLTDPSIHFSICCGSARLLPGGDWVAAWGATPYIEELTPTDSVVFRLRFGSTGFSYRGVPILPGQLSLSSLIEAMNTMYPRTPSG